MKKKNLQFPGLYQIRDGHIYTLAVGRNKTYVHVHRLSAEVKI